MADHDDILDAQIGDTVAKPTGRYSNVLYGTITSFSRSRRNITVLWENGRQTTVTRSRYDALMLQPKHAKRIKSGDP